MSEITVTLASLSSGQSESIPVPSSTTVRALLDLGKALLGLPGNHLRLMKEGRILSPSMTLGAAGVVHGDVLAIQVQAQASAPPPPPVGSGGLDFSNLLAMGSAPAEAAAPSAQNSNPPPVYYPGMGLEDAIFNNPHPKTLVELLFEKDVLLKELNYHRPTLASKLKAAKDLDAAAQVWREEMVKGGIRSAVATTEKRRKELTMRDRLQRDPDDKEAKEYFEREKHQKEINEQYTEMMQEYPEAMGNILMLYIAAKVNGTAIQGLVDSGAQSTIMSKKCAEACGISHLIDTQFQGTALGVGTGKILGRIHIVRLEIGGAHFPCSVTVMEEMGQREMDFLLGLDMLKRHTCQIDLERGCLRFQLGPGQHMSTPFLHEKDLDQTKGGTRDFDADQANRELMEEMKKREKDGGDDMET
mmetsp:Transcript_17532/g.40748  ORF Transcript_17532/g.40748 Transcript_17532/m.40748 type:complete len:415 (+) Transcript_17532:80-1324(+)